MDVLNTTGDPAVADAAVGLRAAPGVVVGAVSTVADPVASSIEYPVAQEQPATQFAQAVGVPALLVPADVPQVTVVLGPRGLETLLSGLEAFPGLPCG